jgi:hypothetical protein
VTAVFFSISHFWAGTSGYPELRLRVRMLAGVPIEGCPYETE